MRLTPGRGGVKGVQGLSGVYFAVIELMDMKKAGRPKKAPRFEQRSRPI
jgi:hypothetical protein